MSYPAGTGPQTVLTADFNGDARLDLAVVNCDSSNVSVLLGSADGTFQSALTSATGAGPKFLAVGDFDEDGKLDLATANINDVSVLLGNGNGTFQPPNNIGGGGPKVCDFNWLQHWENVVDPFHVPILHGSFSGPQFVAQMAQMPKVEFSVTATDLNPTGRRVSLSPCEFQTCKAGGNP
jgi:hypothetical protein